MKVNNWLWKRRTAVVVAFDGQNVCAPNSFGSLQNHQIGEVAATDENIGGRRFNAMPDAIIVCQNKKIHQWLFYSRHLSSSSSSSSVSVGWVPEWMGSLIIVASIPMKAAV